MPEFNEFPEIISDDRHAEHMAAMERSWEKMQIDAATRAWLSHWADWEEGEKDA